MTTPQQGATVDTADPRRVVTEGLAGADLAAALRWAVAHAALAPSELNAQPWAFEIDSGREAGTIRLRLDRSRSLGGVDPGDREAVLACGAALLNLRLALTGAELLPEVLLCPEPVNRELLACVTVRRPTREHPDQLRLRTAITQRASYRGPFEATALSPELAVRLAEGAADEGAACSVVPLETRPAVAELVNAGHEALWSRPDTRREAASWTRSNLSSATDGVPGYAFSHGLVRSLLDPALEQRGRAPWPASSQVKAVIDAPLLMAVGSQQDSRADLLRAGAAMQRLLLTVTAEGLVASFVNAPLQDTEHRAAMGRLLGLACPQVLVRAGRGPHAFPTPRRPLGDVLVVRRRHD